MINQPEHFRLELQQALDQYFPEWDEGICDLFAHPKTLRNWTHKPTRPQPKMFENFLAAANRQNIRFPSEPLRKQYKAAFLDADGDIGEAHEYYGAEAYQQRFNRLCGEAAQQICVLQNWMNYPEKFVENLVEAVKRGISCQYLLLHPNSHLVKRRLEERKRRFEFILYLEDMIAKIYLARLDQFANFSLYLYDTTPPFVAYIVDEDVLLGQHWIGIGAPEEPFLPLKASSRYSCWYDEASII